MPPRIQTPALRQVQEVAALLHVAIGALDDLQFVLQHMHDLAVLAQDDIHSQADRADLQLEMNQLAREVDRIAHSTAINGKQPFTGAFAAGKHLQAGTLMVSFAIPAMTADALKLTGGRGGGLSIGFKAQATRAIAAIEAAMHTVRAVQAELRVVLNRLHFLVAKLRVEADDTLALKRRITNFDMAEAVTHVLRAQILRQPTAAVSAHTKLSQGLLLRFPRRKSGT
ncbi:Flagellar filament 30.7 kDa core protein [compost metagenome]